MATLRMRNLINRWGPAVLSLFLLVKFLQVLKRFGIKAKEDGWRKVTRVFLRTEQSKFALACFGLNFCPNQPLPGQCDLENKKIFIIKSLSEFFKHQPDIQWKIEWFRFSAKRTKKELIDIVAAEFNADGSLQGIVDYLDQDEDLNLINHELKITLNNAIVEFYNITKDFNDKYRPLSLKKKLNQWLSANLDDRHKLALRQACDYIERVLSATFISFQMKPDFNYRRFEPPIFIRHKHPGYGLLNIVCRLNNQNNDADLWFQCNHVPIDGLPMQEVLDKIKEKWGQGEVFRFTSGYQIITNEPQLCSSAGAKKAVYCLNRIVNFGPLICLGKELNKKYINQNHRAVTLLRLLIWEIGIHPVFNGKKFIIPVIVPGGRNRERGLGFVLIRPSIYFDKNDPEKGFVKFQQEFNRQVKAAMARKNECYELFESYALLPTIAYTIALKVMPRALREFVGDIGITIINTADIFIAPFSDVHAEGFIAISNIFTPTLDGKFACNVSIKGPKDKISDYLATIEDVAKGQG